ncbi:hypothetical protein BTS2_2123 [Bacillus sp. TS-2]|nr:hypothetical protein BTS2_2123 [Bacillus sp. TS-2]
MADIYIFNKEDVLLTILTTETGLVNALVREELNQVSNQPLQFTVEAIHESSQFVVEENQVVIKDKDSDYRIYSIKELEEVDNEQGPLITAICEPGFLELSEKVLVDFHISNKSAEEALSNVLKETRWQAETLGDWGRHSVLLNYESVMNGIRVILSKWGGEIKDVIEFDDTGRSFIRKIKHVNRLGKDTGKRFEINHDIEEIERKVLSYPVTALYGLGQDEDGLEEGITFKDIEWSKANGDPANKPKGQIWVGDSLALEQYGRYYNGELIHREAVWKNSDIQNPSELLDATWQQLQLIKKPEVHYSLKVELLERYAGFEHEKVSLGDTVRAVDRNFSKPIEIQARVIAIEYDLLDIAQTAVVEVGNFLSIDRYDERLEEIVNDFKLNRNKWEKAAKPITNERFPDIKPLTPVIKESQGSYSTINIWWSYNEELYVNAYELYASQVKGFIPREEHLIYRGKGNGTTHNVEVNQQWYYKVRAINTHGTPSDFSEESMATTARIMTDAILFGPELAEKLRELHETADIIGRNGVDFDNIRQEVLDRLKADAKVYTDQEIQETEKALMQELADKAGLGYVDGRLTFVEDSMDSLSNQANELLDRVKDNAEQLVEQDGKIITVTSQVDIVKGSLSTTIDTINRVEGDLNSIENTVVDLTTDIEGVSTSVSRLRSEYENTNNKITQVEAELIVQAGVIAGKAEQTEILSLNGDINNVRNRVGTLELSSIGFSSQISDLRSDFNRTGKWNQSYRVRLDNPHNLTELNGGLLSDLYSYEVTAKTVGTNTETTAIAIFRANNSSGNGGNGWILEKLFENGTSSNHPEFFLDENGRPSIRLYRHSSYYDVMVTHTKYIGSGTASTALLHTISLAETAIDQNAYAITQRATQTSVNHLTGRLTTAESQITTMADQIDLKVSRDGIVSALNLTPEQVKIDTRLLSIGNFSNLIQNANFKQDLNGHAVTRGSWRVIHNNASARIQGTSCLEHRHVEPSQEGRIALGGDHYLEVDAGEEYYFSIWYRAVGTGPFNQVRLEIRYLDANRNFINFRGGSANVGATTWRIIEGSAVMPEGARYACLYLRVMDNGNNQRYYFQDPVLRRKADTNVIVNGAIAANHLSANSVTFGNGAIANAAITSANLKDAIIQNVHIEDGTISSAKIQSLTADKINTGTLKAIDITGVNVTGSVITSTNGSNNSTIQGGYVESSGRYVRTWMGSTSNNNVDIRIQNGYIRARNNTRNHSLYFSDFGISTYADGVGDGASGTIAFRDTSYSTAGGLTIQSTPGVVALKSDNNRVVIDAYQTATIDSSLASIYIRPMKNNRSGTNEFRFWVKDNPSFNDTDGVLSYGTSEINSSSGLRFKKSIGGDPIVHMTNGAGDINSGKAQGISFLGDLEAQGDDAFIRVNNELRITDKRGYNGGNTSLRGLQARSLRVNDMRVNGDSSHLYLGVSTGELRVSNNTLDNSGNPTYRPIRAAEFFSGTSGRFFSSGGVTYVQGNTEVRATRYLSGTLVPMIAQAFNNSSSRSLKENIKPFHGSGLEVVNDLFIVNYDWKSDLEDGIFDNCQIGVISEDSPAISTKDGKMIKINDLLMYNTKAIQELSSDMEDVKDAVSLLKVENQLLRKEVKLLREMNA